MIRFDQLNLSAEKVTECLLDSAKYNEQVLKHDVKRTTFSFTMEDEEDRVPENV